MTQLNSRVSEAAIDGCQFENLGGQFLDVISATREKADFCIDGRGLSILLTDKRLHNIIKTLVSSDVKLRFVTNITPENISDCKILLKYCDAVYHIGRVKGNFLILDQIKYLFYVLEHELENDKKVQKLVIKQVLYNNDISFVDTQQYLFESLCDNAICAKDKIKEIERGSRGDFTDILHDPSEIQSLVINILEAASYEILVLFSTINLFHIAEGSGILNSLWQASQRGVAIKMLMRSDDKHSRDIVQKAMEEKHLPINVQYITKPLQNKIATLVIDHSTSFAIEYNDKEDMEKAFNKNTMTAIYSNNELTVSSCTSIFETLWIQSEFDKQNKVKQAYFQIFKGLELRDETYRRHWSASKKL
jgi:hypothetical protein